MKETEKVQRTVEEVVAIKCSDCGTRFGYDNPADQMELQEFLFVDFVGGYGSVFGDCNRVTAELCQRCVQKRLGDVLTINSDCAAWDIDFEGLIHLDQGDLQKVLRDVDGEVLTLALKTASDDLSEKVYKNLSPRASEFIRARLADLGPSKLTDVENAQQCVMDTVYRLAENGEVSLPQRLTETLEAIVIPETDPAISHVKHLIAKHASNRLLAPNEFGLSLADLTEGSFIKGSDNAGNEIEGVVTAVFYDERLVGVHSQLGDLNVSFDKIRHVATLADSLST